MPRTRYTVDEEWHIISEGLTMRLIDEVMYIIDLIAYYHDKH